MHSASFGTDESIPYAVESALRLFVFCPRFSKLAKAALHCLPSCQKAMALAAATFRESTPWLIGMRTV